MKVLSDRASLVNLSKPSYFCYDKIGATEGTTLHSSPYSKVSKIKEIDRLRHVLSFSYTICNRSYLFATPFHVDRLSSAICLPINHHRMKNSS